jgi:hypothetical protein
MSSPVSSAAMPAEALHTATATPMISAVSELAAELWVAEVMAWLKTFAAPGGSAFPKPATSRCTTLLLMCSRLVRPSSAISAGNSAKNQWKARLPAVIAHRSTLNFLPVLRRVAVHRAASASSSASGPDASSRGFTAVMPALASRPRHR